MVQQDRVNENGESENVRKLFIGGLSPNTTEDTMREFYGQYGEVVDVIVMRDPTTKRSRGFGFITYALRSQVDDCMAARPHVIDAKTVDPKRAVPREASSRGEANVSSKRLYVSGVREDHTEEHFQEYFGKYGPIEKIDIVADKATGKPRGFAFINFADYDAVDQAIIDKSHQVNGHRCDVKKGLSKEEMAKAQQKEMDRSQRSGRSGRGGAAGGGWQQGGYGGGRGGGYAGGQQGGWGGGYGGAAAGGYGGGYGGAQQQGGWGAGADAWGQQAQGWGAQQGAGAQAGQQAAWGAQQNYGGSYGAAGAGRGY